LLLFDLILYKMAGSILLSVLGFTLLLAYVSAQQETSEADPEKLKALCARYKFLWSDAAPEVFYYCFTNKAAVQLKCRAGYYMCKREGSAFHPCDCKLGDDTSNEVTGGDSVEETNGEYLSRGCPDPFLLYANYHRHGGIEQPDFPTLALCQRECFIDTGCIGLDWEAESKTCYLHYKEAQQYSLSIKEGIDHYMRTKCKGTSFGVTPGTNDIEPTEDVENLPSHYNPDKDSNSDSSFDRQEIDQFLNALGGNSNVGGRQAVTQTSAASTVSPTASTPGPPTVASAIAPTPGAGTLNGATIPDAGCPDPFQAFVGKRQHAGWNITTGDLYNTPEKCKFYCLLYNGYCAGVDFDTNTNTCYRHTELKVELQQDGATGVTHYQRLTCGRQLACYSITGSASDQNLQAIIDPNTPKIACRGYCTTMLQLSTTGAGVLTRGCATDAELLALGLPDTNTRIWVSPTSPQLIVVSCATGLCNGLSIPAATSLMAHLSFDGNSEDQSGMKRHGFTQFGAQDLQYTTLSSLLNGSAVFTGDNCIEIPSLSNYALGTQANDGTPIPQMTIHFAFNRFDGTNAQGLAGNSNDANIEPSVAIYSVDGYNNIYRAGVSTLQNPGKVDDYQVQADPNVWNHFTMTYDGRDLILLNKPELIVYLNGVPLTGMGNAKDDIGDIQVRADPFYIGCIPGLSIDNFSGMIDEFRIFSSALSHYDVEALNLMTELGIKSGGI
jgi:hypothetical protein